MAGVLKVICPTAKAKFCPSGCFAAATAQWNWQGAKRLWNGLSPSKPIMGNCDEAVRVGEGVNLIVASPFRSADVGRVVGYIVSTPHHSAMNSAMALVDLRSESRSTYSLKPCIAAPLAPKQRLGML